MPSINESLAIIANKRLIFTKGKLYFAFLSDLINVLHSLKIKLISTGDLEYYFTVLGRINMSSNYCF